MRKNICKVEALVHDTGTFGKIIELDYNPKFNSVSINTGIPSRMECFTEVKCLTRGGSIIFAQIFKKNLAQTFFLSNWQQF